MKAGFWVAPEGENAAAVLRADRGRAPRRGAPLSSATPEADALIRRCPLTAALLPELVAALAAQRAERARKTVRHHRISARTSAS